MILYSFILYYFKNWKRNKKKI